MTFQKVFMPYTKMRKRFDAVMQGSPDPFPGSSGSEDIEKMMNALSNGSENPYGLMRMETKARARKPEEYPVVKPVANAFIEAFENLKEA